MGHWSWFHWSSMIKQFSCCAPNIAKKCYQYLGFGEIQPDLCREIMLRPRETTTITNPVWLLKITTTWTTITQATRCSNKCSATWVIHDRSTAPVGCSLPFSAVPSSCSAAKSSRTLRHSGDEPPEVLDSNCLSEPRLPREPPSLPWPGLRSWSLVRKGGVAKNDA